MLVLIDKKDGVLQHSREMLIHAMLFLQTLLEAFMVECIVLIPFVWAAGMNPAWS
jgi:hypothetical protein